MTTAEMFNSHPSETRLDRELLARTVDALLSCAQACTVCADACLSEEQDARMGECIRTDLNCADICATTARVLSRHTGDNAEVARAQLEACVQACRSCGDECERHADHHEHCRICAEACRTCEQACRDLLATMP